MRAPTTPTRSLVLGVLLGTLVAGCGRGADTAADDTAADDTAADDTATGVTVDASSQEDDVQGRHPASDEATDGQGMTAEQRRSAREQLEQPVRPAPPARLRPSEQEATPIEPGATDQVPADRLEAAVAQAADAAGVERAQVAVVRAEAVTWPSGALGCPEPGMAYTEALIDGYWVVAEAAGEQVDLRGGRSGGFRVCPPGQGSRPVPARDL